MAALAEVADLEALLGRTLTGADLTRAEAVLERVSSLVRSEADLTWDDTAPPDAVVTIVLDVALRVYANPLNLRASTTGPFSGTLDLVGLHLTPQERRVIRQAAGKRSGLHVMSFGRDEQADDTIYVPTGPPPSGYPFPWYAADDPLAGT